MRGVEVHECESGVEPHVGVWRQMCVRRVWTASSRDTGEDSVNTYCLCLYV